ncbi:hypothetical protein TWF173_011094 [Orbilia oligospora]|nr:hypothetical protein TWF173_011094 [Orbilia oligospora]
MHFITASVLSLCVTATLAAPARISRRSTLNGSQRPLGDTIKVDRVRVDSVDRSRVFVDIPLTLAEITSAEIGAPASSVRFYGTLDTEQPESEMIRVVVDLKSLRAARKNPDCDFAFRKEKKPDLDYLYEFDPEERLAVFSREDTGLWSVRCLCMDSFKSGYKAGMESTVPSSSVEDVEWVVVPEEEPVFKPEDVEEVPDFREEEPKEVTEVLEETTEVTTEVFTKVTTKVTTEFTRKNSADEDAEEASEQTYEENIEIESSSRAMRHSIGSEEYSPEAEETDDMKRQRGVAVNEFDIEII